MSLQGNLKEFNLLEIFQLLSLGAKSGRLTVEKDSQYVKFIFRKGAIALCINSKRPLPYRTLVNMGVFTEEEYQKITRLGENDLQQLEDLIATRGEPEQKKIEQFFRKQILDDLLEISPWNAGGFSFEASQIDGDPGYSVSVPEIEIEAKKCLKEWEEIKEQLPAEDEPIGLSPDTAELGQITVNPEEWRIICFLARSKTLGELREEISLSAFSLSKILVSLMKKKLIRKDLASAPSKNKKSLSLEISRHFGGRKIKKQKIDIEGISGKYVVLEE